MERRSTDGALADSSGAIEGAGLGWRSLSVDTIETERLRVLSMLILGDLLPVSPEGLLDMDGREGETSFGVATIEAGAFDCRLDQNEKKPPDAFEPGDSASGCDCFSTIRHPTGTTSSSTVTLLCLTAVSQAVEPRAAM